MRSISLLGVVVLLPGCVINDESATGPVTTDTGVEQEYEKNHGFIVKIDANIHTIIKKPIGVHSTVESSAGKTSEKPKPENKIPLSIEKEMNECRAEIQAALASINGPITQCRSVESNGFIFNFAESRLEAVVDGHTLKTFRDNVDDFCLFKVMTQLTGAMGLWTPLPVVSDTSRPCLQLMSVIKLNSLSWEAYDWEQRNHVIFSQLETMLKVVRFSFERGVSVEIKVSFDIITLLRFRWETRNAFDINSKGGLEKIADFVVSRIFDPSPIEVSESVPKQDPLILFIDAVARFDYIGGSGFDFNKWISLFSDLNQGKKVELEPLSVSIPRSQWWELFNQCVAEKADVVDNKSCIDIEIKCGQGTQLRTMEEPKLVFVDEIESTELVFSTSVGHMRFKVDQGDELFGCEPAAERLCEERTSLETVNDSEGTFPQIVKYSADTAQTDCGKFSFLLTRMDGENAYGWLENNAKNNPKKVMGFLIKAMKVLEKVHRVGLSHGIANVYSFRVLHEIIKLDRWEAARPFLDAEGNPVVWGMRVNPMKSDLNSLVRGLDLEDAKPLFREIAKLGLFEIPDYSKLIALLTDAEKDPKFDHD